MNTYLLHLDAGRDTNGNPRRCYVQYDADGAILGCWDEGYKGRSAAPTGKNVIELGTVPTTASFRRKLLKEGEQT